jgi:hypothetical protein
MEQLIFAMNLTAYGLEFDSPVVGFYMPWVSLGLALVIGGTIGIVKGIKTIKGNK